MAFMHVGGDLQGYFQILAPVALFINLIIALDIAATPVAVFAELTHSVQLLL